MNDITRIDSGPRMSQAVCFGGLVHTAGQVAIHAVDEDVQGQTRAVLEAIDGLLEAAMAPESDHQAWAKVGCAI